MNYALRKDRFPIWIAGVVVLLEVFFFLLLMRQESLGVMYLSVVCGVVLLYFFPEISLSFAFSGNILLHVLYDYAKIQIPFFALIFGSFLLALGAFIQIEKNCYDKEIDFGKLFKISLAIAVLMAIGLLFSTDRNYGTTKLVLYLLINVPVLAIIALYRDEYSAIQRLLFFNILIGLVLALLSFLAAEESLLFGQGRFYLSENVGPLGVARPLTIAIVSVFFFIANYRNLLSRLFFIGIIPFLLAPVVWSGSRGPLIAIFVGALTFVVLQPRVRIWPKLVIFFSFVLAGALFLLYSSSQVSQRLATPLAEEASAAFRVLAWIQSIQDFAAHPLTGIGTGSFFLDSPFLPLVYPHNLVLELACENGILGLVLILCFFALTVKFGLFAIKKFDQAKNNMAVQLCIGVSALFVNSWINAMVSGNISNNSFVWLSAGLVWILYKSSQSDEMSLHY